LKEGVFVRRSSQDGGTGHPGSPDGKEKIKMSSQRRRLSEALRKTFTRKHGMRYGEPGVKQA